MLQGRSEQLSITPCGVIPVLLRNCCVQHPLASQRRAGLTFVPDAAVEYGYGFVSPLTCKHVFFTREFKV